MMISVDVRAANGICEIYLSGKIDEKLDVAAIASQAGQATKVRLSLAQVRSISSMGLRSVESLVEALGRGRDLVLSDISPALATQMAVIPNLCGGVAVEAARLPFVCPACSAEASHMVPWKANALATLSPKCTCGAVMELDGLAEQYLPS